MGFVAVVPVLHFSFFFLLRGGGRGESRAFFFNILPFYFFTEKFLFNFAFSFPNFFSFLGLLCSICFSFFLFLPFFLRLYSLSFSPV